VFRQRSFCEKGDIQKIRVDDIEIAYKVFGSGEPLVMVTGYIATMEYWDPLFVKTLASRFRVIVFDNRGMGATTGGTEDWTIDRFADDTAGMIQLLGIKAANVLGWSLGGDVALSLAVRHPEIVKKLVVYAGDCGGPEKVKPPGYLSVLHDYDDVDSHFKWFFAELFPPEWMRRHPRYWKSFQLPCEMPNPLNIIKQNSSYNEWRGVYRELPELRIPVLAVTGTKDVSTPPDNSRIISERIPGCRLVEVPGGGHGLQYQFPRKLARIIIGFLSGRGDGGT
jgi:pimeloyl-ACP methyl ester carboxylesterase